MIPIINDNIINHVRQGESDAFEHLYRARYALLCSIAVKYVYDPEVTREIVNDVFLNVWNNRFSLTFPVDGYLVRAVQNRSLNYLRKKRIQEMPLTEGEEHLSLYQESLVFTDADPLACLENKEIEEKVREAIGRLTEKCREIFMMHIYKRLNSEEKAKNKNISSSTVRGQIRLGLAKLKDMLSDLYPLVCFLFDFL